MKHTFKRFLTIAVIAAAVIFTLTACGNTGLGSKSDGDAKVTKKAPKDLKVGVSLSTLSNPFFVSVRNGIQDLAKKNKTNVQVSDAQNDTAKQNNNIEDMIQKKVDILIINPVDSSAITPAVKDANDAGIPVITVDRSSDGGKVLTLVASNSKKGGEMAAKYMIEKLGKNAKIAELQGIPGASATRERGKGFDGAAKGQLDIVSKQTAGFDRAKGLTVTENILQGNGDIVGIFSQNDEMALGAVQAVKAAGKKITIVGFDGEADGIKAVKAGDMAATVAQKQEEVGRLALQAAYDHFDGKTIKKNIESPLSLVTTEDANK
ncbi:substrate-binding domain-containing protein [Lacticaseibacillus rhamnosus]|uniref:substrate-binding domain-containing protein n=1 Tax=Lacticaseibacillus rhamnosus TaxID=47715 RepID=UPI0007E0454F|nr:substrate-binding domain-containing protein [Lacticaseibacillus rhamnosus]OAU12751.1 D-ribose transporter subunit RbsB [Lacticaseibacillus rhamnosus]OAU22266.1 D-ribose transporter subunit RbsB [Lacticaseibacillus rhamnosus]